MREAASPAISGSPESYLPGGQKGCFPQQPQVNESNVSEIRVRGGQPGILSGQFRIGADCRTLQ